MLRYGVPRTVLWYGSGFGDHLLCTAVFHELRKRGHRGLWMASGFEELFRGNPDIDAVVPIDWRYQELAKRVGGRSVMPVYADIDPENENNEIPTRHIIALMCEKLDIQGEVELRPYLHLTDDEKKAGRLVDNQVAIQSSILAARLPILNKEWDPARFAAVVQALKGEFNFVQVGSPRDPLLPGVIDMRGKSSVRQTAAILGQSRAFVGLVGFVMHLARAVDCRAAIVFGGREAPWQSGYTCNENLHEAVECAPCWQWSRCDHDRVCMKNITVDRVVEAVRKTASRHGQPLEVESITL